MGASSYVSHYEPSVSQLKPSGLGISGNDLPPIHQLAIPPYGDVGYTNHPHGDAGTRSTPTGISAPLTLLLALAAVGTLCGTEATR